MTPVHAQLIERFQNGRRKVFVVTEPGSVPVMTKAEGQVNAPYSAGDALLANEDDDVLFLPTGLPGAVALAGRVLDGDSRALTDPVSMLVLATALVAFSKGGDEHAG